MAARRKGTTATQRLRAVCCPACGYRAYITRKWLAEGLPACPCGRADWQPCKLEDQWFVLCETGSDWELEMFVSSLDAAEKRLLGLDGLIDDRNRGRRMRGGYRCEVPTCRALVGGCGFDPCSKCGHVPDPSVGHVQIKREQVVVVQEPTPF